MLMRLIIAFAAAMCLGGCSRPSAPSVPQLPIQQATQPIQQQQMPQVSSVEQQLAAAGLKSADAPTFVRRYNQIYQHAGMTEMELVPVVTKLLQSEKGNAARVTSYLDLLDKHHKKKPSAKIWENAVMVTMMCDANFAPDHLKNNTEAMNIYRKLAVR